jgi:hypothetical protein
VVLIKVGPPLEWQIFRDVFQVDGRPVRDRDGRLARLFLAPAATARAQARRIEDESARFNISNVGRILNVPGLPLVFLQPAIQPRFRFTFDRQDGGDGVWIVRYEEQARPTVFQHNATEDNPSVGRLWIDVETGEVVRTEHIVRPARLSVTFTTRFRHHDQFGVAVPTEMHEQIAGSTGAVQSLDGIARYSNLRRFEVRTEDVVVEP